MQIKQPEETECNRQFLNMDNDIQRKIFHLELIRKKINGLLYLETLNDVERSRQQRRHKCQKKKAHICRCNLIR